MRMCDIWLGAVIALIGLSFNDIVDVAQEKEGNDHSSEWPFLRGPNFDGHSAEVGLAESWSSDGPPVLWVRELGQGYSGFVAHGQRVFTQRQTLGGQTVVCLNADSGETLWEHRYDWPYETAGIYPGPRATPTLSDGRLYFASPYGLVGCLTLEGQSVWSVNVFERFGRQDAGFGYSCSPVVADGKVLLPIGEPGASLVALNAMTGQTVWQAGDDKASYVPAMPMTVDGHQQVIGLLENVLVSHDLVTGKRLWRKELSNGYDEHSAWPIYSEPYLWITAPFRSGSRLLKLTGGDNAGFENVWQSPLLSNDVASSVLIDGHLFGFDLRDAQSKAHRASHGMFRCLDFLTGQERWATDKVGHATIVVAAGKLILFNDQGEVILARASTEQYKELARVTVFPDEICWTAPMLHRGRLYLRNQSRAICLDLGHPQQLSDSKLAAKRLTVKSLPQARLWKLEALLGAEPEYAFDVPSYRWLRDWFVISLGGILGSSALIAVCLQRGLKWRSSRPAFWSIAFALGAVATTPLSIWRNEFTFTWPVCLFISFEACLAEALSTHRTVDSTDNTQRTQSWWRRRLPGLWFLATAFGYYWICRRLSLVNEWCFLFGFPTMFVVTIALQRGLARCGLNQKRPLQWFITSLSFAAFYWSAVGFLAWKYEIPS